MGAASGATIVSQSSLPFGPLQFTAKAEPAPISAGASMRASTGVARIGTLASTRGGRPST